MSYLTDQEIIDVFVNADLKGNYNLLRDDLIKLAHAFIKEAEPKIRAKAKEES